MDALGISGTPDLSELTERELEVIALVAQGYTNLEIATQLCLSPSTVKTHLDNIAQKVGIRRRTQLAGLYWQRTASVDDSESEDEF
jgi:DNA-binding NarL/FixJ family response regulator